MLDDDGNRALVDFDFDMYGYCSKNDPLSRTLEKFDKFHANLIGANDRVFTRLFGEGGDREFNGDGILMTIEETEVLKRNPGMEKEEVDITPDDDCYCNWEQARFDYGDKLLDGSDFPTGTMNVLPAMSYCNFLIANGIILA